MTNFSETLRFRSMFDWKKIIKFRVRFRTIVLAFKFRTVASGMNATLNSHFLSSFMIIFATEISESYPQKQYGKYPFEIHGGLNQ